MEKIAIETIVNRPLAQVWDAFTLPEHVMRWNYASDDWHCPDAKNDLRTGGMFSYTMASTDGAMSFEFYGTYEDVQPHSRIFYKLGDGREVEVLFSEENGVTSVKETFDPENIHPPEMQRAGWRAILDNFRKHTESL